MEQIVMWGIKPFARKSVKWNSEEKGIVHLENR